MSGNLYGKGISTIPYLTPTDSTIGNISISTMGNTKIIPRVIKVTGVTLNKATLALAPTETGTLVATVSPNNADTKTVTWVSDTEAVATVDEDGVVTAIGVGTATITATSDMVEEVVAECDVTVAIFVTGVTLDQETLALTESGATGTLVATVAPANATVDTVTWSSSDETVATVSNGVVTPLIAGTTIITVTTTDGSFTATCEVTVS